MSYQGWTDTEVVTLLSAAKRQVEQLQTELRGRHLCDCGGALRTLAKGEQPRPITVTSTLGPGLAYLGPNVQCEGCGAWSGSLTP